MEILKVTTFPQTHITITDTNATETENRTPRIIITNPAEVFFTYTPPRPSTPIWLSIILTLPLNSYLTKSYQKSRLFRWLIQISKLKQTQVTPMTIVLQSFKSTSISIIWNQVHQSWSETIKIYPNWPYFLNYVRYQASDCTNHFPVTGLSLRTIPAPPVQNAMETMAK